MKLAIRLGRPIEEVKQYEPALIATILEELSS